MPSNFVLEHCYALGRSLATESILAGCSYVSLVLSIQQGQTFAYKYYSESTRMELWKQEIDLEFLRFDARRDVRFGSRCCAIYERTRIRGNEHSGLVEHSLSCGSLPQMSSQRGTTISKRWSDDWRREILWDMLYPPRRFTTRNWICWQLNHFALIRSFSRIWLGNLAQDALRDCSFEQDL